MATDFLGDPQFGTCSIESKLGNNDRGLSS